MGFLQHMFSLFLLFSAVYPTISDHTPLTCGDNKFFIQYPFRLIQQGHKTHHHDYPFLLKCNSQGFVVVTLRYSGDFYVRDIDYFNQRIQIYDPGNCIAGRMKNLSLSSSPYVAGTYQNYTFFTCPTSSSNVSVIGCLSNSTASVLATSSLSMADEVRNLTGCRVIYSLQIPVFSPFQYDNGFNGDLQLAWDDPGCKGDCKGGSTSKSVIGIIIIGVVIISIASLGSLFCIACCLILARTIVENNEGDIETSHSTNTRVWEMLRITLPQPLAPSGAAATGDKFSTEEVIIGGSRCISGPNSDSCPICLEEYKASERLRVISICKHCFHADCLEKWLQRETTCPICRTTVI